MTGALSQRLLAQVEEADQNRATITIYGDEVEVWASELTGADTDVINKAIMTHAQKKGIAYQSFQQDSTQIAGLVEALILKLRMVQDGECVNVACFTRADRAVLMRTPLKHLGNWARAVFGSEVIDDIDDEEALGELEKNS